jgi:hypothetical protein
MRATVPEDYHHAELLRNAKPNAGLHIADRRVALEVSLSFFSRKVMKDGSKDSVHDFARLSERPYRKELDLQED